MERPFMIFKALPWTDFSVNEGSFLRAYTQYEYFLKSPPSILTGRTIQSTLQLPKPFLRKLKHFNYSAIFPFYNHVSSVMSLIESTMPNLESLSICLSPHPDEYDAINAQEIRESSGKIDFDDVWMEFETSYEVVAFHVGQLAWKAKLRTFKSVDWTFGGEPRKITEERIAAQLERQGRTITYHQSSEGLNVPVGKPPHKWVPQGDGTWQFQLAEVDDVPILEAT
ncbi:putative f-box domain-containing protein [Phaeomoniella chlamydospora]|uniref:Putative f-box domain-containing protein n=1 Tax=Phaeomoniella chlamydospora TaxID=158046 RepID=A0A0G2F060_PHACM|nr:putative f-box domain-containing protein [Phaeomoniella chlamydospora]